uniref:Glyco_trans_2-like domain-containing protein n=2 Tax=Strongyloides stercoralis TaxID=6248 RepID=A0A0K0E3D6_STRER
MVSSYILATTIIYNVNNAVYLNSSLIIPQLRTNNLYNIKIVTIVNSLNTNKYEVAIRTTKCYAAHFKYEYYLIVIKDGDTLSGKCCQEDFMYKRHCFLSYYMKENFKDGDFVLVLDADIGIINPSYLLETFIPKAGEEIIFYERIFNHEIMAGSFFLKNSKYTRNFLLNWSYYDFKHPNSFDGSDNVGLHYFLLDYIPIEFKMRKGKCYKLWEKAKNWKDCSVFVACIRYIINKIMEE